MGAQPGRHRSFAEGCFTDLDERQRSIGFLLPAILIDQKEHHSDRLRRAAEEFFDELFPDISNGQEDIEKKIDDLIDRPLEQLDPIELSIMLIGVHELERRVDVPYKVVINEGVNLAKRFGSTDGHKYINACLDVAAQALREVEVQANAGG